MPKNISIFVGNTNDNLNEINNLNIDPNEHDGDLLILENCKIPYEFIEIRILSCQSNFIFKLIRESEREREIRDEV
jgi:hypothetical protein